ncbi:MAG: sulfatase [Armatimonadota bacterium]
MRRPNILVFLTDDHGKWASGCYGARELRTPTLDWLAAEGTRFTRATTPCPVCSPARASFWTGRIPSQHGVHDWIHEPTRDRAWLSEERTLAEVLSASNYRTGFAGKWHCGRSWEPQPGFDYYLGENKEQYPHRGTCRFAENGRPVVWEGRREAFVTRKAVDFLATDKERPFFLFVGYVATHAPFKDQPARLAARHARSKFPTIPRETYRGAAKPVNGLKPVEAEHRRRLREYAAAVEYIDEQVGEVLDVLESDGRLDDTLVVYTSDHGHMNGHHGLWLKGNATVPQNFLDESIGLPCLMRWPGRVPVGVFDGPFDHCDLFRTVLAAAGARETEEAERARNSPGADVLPVLGKTGGAWRDATFCEYGNARMVRTNRWKLIVRWAPHVGDELYDLERDPRETTNRIADPECAGALAELRARLERFHGKYDVPGKRGIDPLPDHNGGEPWTRKAP